MSESSTLLFFVYLLPLLLIWGIYGGIKKYNERRALRMHEESRAAGLTEPASLHPLIDPALCRGCGACIAACPEQPHRKVLGLINRRAVLINPTDCIGHGACMTACPFEAITLVFGSEKRGVDIPVVDPHFQTNLPGMYIAGELGGMGLIRNAVVQGVQALANIAELVKSAPHPHPLDVLIVGAGPAGFTASLGCLERRLRYATIEQDSLGGTVFQFPRGKIVMTEPAILPLVGKMDFKEVSKEELLAFWEEVAERTGVQISFQERVTTIEPIDQGYQVQTTRGSYRTRTVLLAIGRRGTPRKLGIPGEELPKVVYRLVDPEQYRGQRVVVVGGGDSALESACSIAEQPDAKVTLSYRSDAFSRARQRNRTRVEQAAERHGLEVMMRSNLVRIDPDSVELEQSGQVHRLANDAVIINAGGILPTGFLKEIGIQIETKYGTR